MVAVQVSVQDVVDIGRIDLRLAQRLVQVPVGKPFPSARPDAGVHEC
jgi:hypothetical protein